jgi:polyisoprenoid-binding protein YceI
MNKQKNILFIILLISSIGLSGQILTTIVKSEIKFSIQNAGLTVNGTLGAVSGLIELNPEKIAASNLELNVSAASINTGISMRDGHLKKKEYFDVAAFPNISLKSKFFGKQGDVFRGYFLLTLKGITKDVTIPFSLKKEGDLTLAEGSFMINRLDFGVGSKSLVMGNEVRITVKVYLNL